MTGLEFLAPLPLARQINDLDNRDSNAQVVRDGNYRLVNEASKRCLSYSSRSAAGLPATTSSQVTGWLCGIPGIDNDLHQVTYLFIPKL
jgi:hypothetical protein